MQRNFMFVAAHHEPGARPHPISPPVWVPGGRVRGFVRFQGPEARFRLQEPGGATWGGGVWLRGVSRKPIWAS